MQYIDVSQAIGETRLWGSARCELILALNHNGQGRKDIISDALARHTIAKAGSPCRASFAAQMAPPGARAEASNRPPFGGMGSMNSYSEVNCFLYFIKICSIFKFLKPFL